MGEEVDLSECEVEIAPPTEIAKAHGLTRDKARDFVRALVRQEELDAESQSVSSDDHLSVILNNPLKDAIKMLEEDNRRLERIIKNNDMLSSDGMNPPMARQMLKDNIKSLIDLRNSLVKSGKEGGGVTIDIGSIFNNALAEARKATEEAPPIDV